MNETLLSRMFQERLSLHFVVLPFPDDRVCCTLVLVVPSFLPTEPPTHGLFFDEADLLRRHAQRFNFLYRLHGVRTAKGVNTLSYHDRAGDALQ